MIPCPAMAPGIRVRAVGAWFGRWVGYWRGQVGGAAEVEAASPPLGEWAADGMTMNGASHLGTLALPSWAPSSADHSRATRRRPSVTQAGAGGWGVVRRWWEGSGRRVGVLRGRVGGAIAGVEAASPPLGEWSEDGLTITNHRPAELKYALHG